MGKSAIEGVFFFETLDLPSHHLQVLFLFLLHLSNLPSLHSSELAKFTGAEDGRDALYHDHGEVNDYEQCYNAN